MSEFDRFAGQYFRDNRFLGGGGARRTALNPATLVPVGAVADTLPAEIDAVIAGANAAQQGWAALAPKERAARLHRVADSIEREQRRYAELTTLEMGKPYPEALGEIANVGPAFRYMAEMARDDGGHVAGSVQSTSFQYSVWEPCGVSVHITPCNYPLVLLAWTLAASLAAGNACIVKPAEVATLTTLQFMEHFRILPPGLVNCVCGGAAAGQQLVESPDTHVVAFTGSVAAGLAVNVACAARMKPCIIEAGGSDALIVCASADPDFAAAAATTAAFHLSGQICTSAERLYVHADVHDAFVERLVARARALRVGNGMQRSEIGPLATEAARARVMRFVDAVVAAGARLECGGGVPPGLETGWFHAPTVLSGMRDDMPGTEEEIFGPVAPVYRVMSFAEAIARANKTRFGLGASIITNDMDEALNGAAALQTGMVWINNPMVDNDALPFGGRKLSGLGRELGRLGLNAFRHPKMIVLDPKPTLYDWWYPYPDSVFHPDADT